MKILFLNDLWDQRIGSSIRQMYQHAEELRRRGHEVLCFSTTPDPELVGEAEELGIPLVRVLSDYNPRWRAWVGMNNRAVVTELEAVLDSFRPDIVHTHLIHTHISYAALAAAQRAGARVVFTAHDVMTFCYQKLTCFHGGQEAKGELRDYAANWKKCIPCQRLRYRPGRNQMIRQRLESNVDRLTVVSDELGAVLRANGLPVHRRVHNALQLQERLPAPEEVTAFRASKGLGDDPVIAIGGRLHEQKGVGQLLAMLPVLLAEFPALKVMVMGKRAVYDQEFASAAKELGVDHAMVPTGWLDGAELQCAYSAVDVFVTPSICFDTFGLVNLEAMEHSRPVVATTFGGSQEVVLDGVTGLIANPFDLEAFSSAILSLLRDPKRAEAMGRAGRERLLESFTIDRLCDEYQAEYETALGLAEG